MPATGAYWTRRIAYDTLVHRWDAEAGAQAIGPPMRPDVAADAVDEMLEVGPRVTRFVTDAPSGPAIGLACTDHDRSWRLDLSVSGRIGISTEPVDVAVTLSGTAEALLLWLWGRIDSTSDEIHVRGDRSVLARQAELLPTA